MHQKINKFLNCLVGFLKAKEGDNLSFLSSSQSCMQESQMSFPVDYMDSIIIRMRFSHYFLQFIVYLYILSNDIV